MWSIQFLTEDREGAKAQEHWYTKHVHTMMSHLTWSESRAVESWNYRASLVETRVKRSLGVKAETQSKESHWRKLSRRMVCSPLCLRKIVLEAARRRIWGKRHREQVGGSYNSPEKKMIRRNIWEPVRKTGHRTVSWIDKGTEVWEAVVFNPDTWKDGGIMNRNSKKHVFGAQKMMFPFDSVESEFLQEVWTELIFKQLYMLT